MILMNGSKLNLINVKGKVESRAQMSDDKFYEKVQPFQLLGDIDC